MSYDLSNYVTANERIAMALEKFPDMVLQFEFKGILAHNPEMIWGIAYLYRTPDDPRPAIGTAAELAIGKTTFTRNSELMNLETSAWARACAAAGIGITRGVATREDVELARDRQPLPDISKATDPMIMTTKQLNLIKSLFGHDFGEMTRYVADFKQRIGIEDADKLNAITASMLIDELKTKGYKPKPKPTIDPDSKD